MTSELAFDPRAFPSAPPPDLDNPDLITRHDWDAFAAVGRMTNHWDRPGWFEGRRVYYWMLTFPHCPRLLSSVWCCQRAVTHLGMDPVADDGLHVTLTRIGDTTHVSPTAIGMLTRVVDAIAPRPFELLAHPLAGSRGALRFSLSPWRPLIHLHALLTEAGRRAGVPGGKPTVSFRPHLGVAYNNRDRSATPVIEAATRLRVLPPVPLRVTAVDVVELKREGAAYRLDVLVSVPLRLQSVQ